MSSKIKESKLRKSVRTSFSTEEKKPKRPPEGAEILSKSIDTSVREIENGFLVTKSYDVSYREKGKEDRDYAYWSEEYYTEEDPLEINIKDQELADAFKEDK